VFSAFYLRKCLGNLFQFVRIFVTQQMVGVGPEGLESAVARVTLCNWAEEVILDTFVKVPVEVTDYRTFVSGIEAKDLESDNALPLQEVREIVQKTLHGKILIGHALENDLAALQISHPWHDTRDSANYPPFMQEVPELGDSSKSSLRPRKLKELVKDRLGKEIQDLGKSHDPVEDALSALRLYKEERLQWEMFVVQKVAAAKVEEPLPYVRDAMSPATLPLPYNHQGNPNMNMNMAMGQNHYQSQNYRPRNRAYSAQHHLVMHHYGDYNHEWVRHRSF
jgi:RNA exonuclease 4